MQPNYSQYTIKLVTCIQYMGGQLEQAIDFNVACYENYCIHKGKIYRYIFKVTRHINDCTKIAGLEVACTVTWTA